MLATEKALSRGQSLEILREKCLIIQKMPIKKLLWQRRLMKVWDVKNATMMWMDMSILLVFSAQKSVMSSALSSLTKCVLESEKTTGDAMIAWDVSIALVELGRVLFNSLWFAGAATQHITMSAWTQTQSFHCQLTSLQIKNTYAKDVCNVRTVDHVKQAKTGLTNGPRTLGSAHPVIRYASRSNIA